MELLSYIDTILVPLSFFVTLGYHAYLWHCFKNSPHLTTIEFKRINRRMWFMSIIENENGRGMVLDCHTLRNTLMRSILFATISLTLNSCLAALYNNTYKARHLLQDTFFGSQCSRTLALKYSSASLILLISFLCHSMAIFYMIEASFLMKVSEFSPGYVLGIFERGFFFTSVGIRALYITFPLLLWMLGPVPMALSSVAMVWVLYKLDFTSNRSHETSELMEASNTSLK